MIVIGAGPAGEVVAGRCADAGLSVAVVEHHLVGGECSYWGCIPSKTLIRPGDVLAAVRRVPGAAQAVTGRLDAAAALARRDYMVSSWRDEGQVSWLSDHRITLVRGLGRISGERRVVAKDDGGVRELAANRAVVLATGTRATIPPVEGLRESRPWDNRTATEATYVPRRLLVLGGGGVGAELAQAFRRLGSDEVTVVEAGPRLLAREEPFAGDEVGAAFAAEGIRVLTGARLVSARREGDGPVQAKLDNAERIEADEILVAVGRTPATDRLGLADLGLRDGRYVEVDEKLRVVGVPGGWLYAIGDCNGLALFTHMGKYQGRIAGDVILGKDATDRSSRTAISRVTFTDPQVCAVGLTEAQARERGLPVRVVRVGTGDVAGATVEGEGISGTSALVVETDREIVVGATFTGPQVQELLHSASIAVAGQVPLRSLWHAVPSFPTVSEVWLRLLESYGL